jgi:predicted amidohydrolase
MKISLIQSDILWEDKAGNLNKLTRLVDTVPSDSEIVILPEMFNTGFSMNPEALCESPHSITFDWMMSMAGKTGSGICGSYIIKEGSSYFNRWIFVTPSGIICQYDKRHLFSPGSEDKLFTPGKKRVVFNFRGVNICPIVCYDLRFPVWCRVRKDYELLIDSANWPESRRDVWLTLLKARALENMCYVAGVNRTGTDGTGTKHCGDSALLDARGKLAASAGRNSECVVTAKISIPDLFEFRKKFPVLDDADKFILEV